MKQYVIDDIRPSDVEKLKKHLDAKYANSCLSGIYWIRLEPEILSDIQKAHVDCQPHYFALELVDNRLCCEFLVRTNKVMRCKCIHYATETQRNWLIRFIDGLLDELEIKA